MLCTIPSFFVSQLFTSYTSYGVAAGGEAFASSVASAMEGVLVSNR